MGPLTKGPLAPGQVRVAGEAGWCFEQSSWGLMVSWCGLLVPSSTSAILLRVLIFEVGALDPPLQRSIAFRSVVVSCSRSSR